MSVLPRKVSFLAVVNIICFSAVRKINKCFRIVGVTQARCNLLLVFRGFLSIEQPKWQNANCQFR